jgi:hypothetical protein
LAEKFAQCEFAILHSNAIWLWSIDPRKLTRSRRCWDEQHVGDFENRPDSTLQGDKDMTRFIARSAFGLVAAAALVAIPAEAKAQYVSNGVGVRVVTPGFGLNVGFGQPVYRPGPVVIPAYPAYSGYGYYPRPVAPATLHWTPYRGWHTHGPYYGPYYPHSHYGHGHGHRH